MSRMKCSRLLGFAIITAAVIAVLQNTCSSAASAFAFAPPSLFSARSNSIQPLKKSTSISTTKLLGYANVNDYFDSFRQDDSSDNDGSTSNNDDGDLKYIGHGRLSSASNDDDIGGAFDVNNYFASFGQSDSGSSSHDDDIISAQEDDDEHDNSSGNEMSSQQPAVPQQPQLTRSEIIAYNNARLDPKSFLELFQNAPQKWPKVVQ